MKVIFVHNYYQLPGGEDESYDADVRLLEAHGHQVVRFTAHNRSIADMPGWKAAASTIWNGRIARELAAVTREVRPDVVHFNNTFPLVSPASYYSVQREGVPVVQTLRNYRLLCLNGLLYRSGKVCMDCTQHRVPWPGVVHRCYRDSTAASATVAGMLTVHRSLNTWMRKINAFIVTSRFAERIFVQNGIPNERLHFRPNFLPSVPEAGNGEGGYALFVGRLSPEKGLDTMLEAWRKVGDRVSLYVVGDGPLSDRVADSGQPGVHWLGRREPEDVLDLIGGARVVIFPSEWYETFGRVVIEALAKGTPVIASDIGAPAELVQDGVTGRLFPPGDANALADIVLEFATDAPAYAHMRDAARNDFLQRYTPAGSYRRLIEIYSHVIEHVEPSRMAATPS